MPLSVESLEPLTDHEFEAGLELVEGEGGALLQQAQPVAGRVAVQQERAQLVARVRSNVPAHAHRSTKLRVFFSLRADACDQSSMLTKH